MKITKDILKICMQGCVNSYNGEYGKVDNTIFDEVYEFCEGHVEGLVAVKDKILYIVFRGSDGGKDWKDNFKFWKKETRKSTTYYGINPKIKVHTGFFSQYMTIRTLIHSIIRDYLESSDIENIIITGHSLGGALSVFCALDVQYNFDQFKNDNLACITFGSPRAGNRHFVKSFNKRVKKSFRFVFEYDLVARVPLLIMGYRHVSKFFRLRIKRNILKKILLSYRAITGSPLNHYPEMYVKGIERLEWK